MKKRFNSLSVQIPIVVNIFIAVLLFISIFTIVRMSNKAIDESTSDGFQSTLRGYATYFDSLVTNQLILANTYSSFTFVINYMENRDAQTETNMLNVLKMMGSKNPYVISLSLIEKDGTIINNSEGNNIDVGKNVSSLYPDLWKKYDAVKRPSLSESMYKDANGNWITAIIAPVNSRTNNTYLGGLLIIIDWQKIVDEITETADKSLNEWVRLWLFNKDTMILTHNLPSYLGINFTQVASIVNEPEGLIIFENDGMPKICFYVAIKNQPWQIGFSMPLSFLTQKSTNILKVGILIGVLGLILSSVIGFFYIRNLMSPLKILVEEAEEMSRGEFILRKFKFKKNEIGDIAYSFKNMRDAMVKIINEVNATSEKINNAAASLAQGSDDLSARTDAQASSLGETASAILL